MCQLIFNSPGVVGHELGVRLSPFSSSNGSCGCSTCSPPAKKSASSQCWYSSSCGDRGVLRAWLQACSPSSMARVRSVSMRGDEAVLPSTDCTISCSGWRDKVKGKLQQHQHMNDNILAALFITAGRVGAQGHPLPNNIQIKIAMSMDNVRILIKILAENHIRTSPLFNFYGLSRISFFTDILIFFYLKMDF